MLWDSGALNTSSPAGPGSLAIHVNLLAFKVYRTVHSWMALTFGTLQTHHVPFWLQKKHSFKVNVSLHVNEPFNSRRSALKVRTVRIPLSLSSALWTDSASFCCRRSAIRRTRRPYPTPTTKSAATGESNPKIISLGASWKIMPQIQIDRLQGRNLGDLRDKNGLDMSKASKDRRKSSSKFQRRTGAH